MIWKQSASLVMDVGETQTVTELLFVHLQIDRHTGMVMNITDLKQHIEVRPSLSSNPILDFTFLIWSEGYALIA